MKWQDVSKIAKENGFVEEYDENLECPILDEDKVSDTLHFEKFVIKHDLTLDGFFLVQFHHSW